MNEFTEQRSAFRQQQMLLEIDALLASEPSMTVAMGVSKESMLLTRFADIGKILLVDTPRGPFSRYNDFETADVTPPELVDKEPGELVEIQVGEKGALPLKDESVELVVCSNLFGVQLCHYSDETYGFLAESMRILKPGGYLVSLAHRSSQESIMNALTDWHARVSGLEKLFSDRHGYILSNRPKCVEITDKLMREFGLTLADPVADARGYHRGFFAVEQYAAFRRKPGTECLNQKQLELLAKAERIEADIEDLRLRAVKQYELENAKPEPFVAVDTSFKGRVKSFFGL